MNATGAIGIFDSGVGGTSIFKEIHQSLPLESCIYLADSINAPYGQKSKEEIIRLSKKNTELLIKMGCKIIVVACNTATTNAITELRESFNTPIIGIEPAIKPAALSSQKKIIGILATKGTLSSELFSKTSELYTQDVEVIEVIGKGLVEAIEAGKEYHTETKKLLRSLLAPMLAKEIDYLVLGCSHYPYLIPLLQEILPPEVKIIDSGQAVAQQTKNILATYRALVTKPQNAPKFYTNKDVQLLRHFVPNPKFEVSYLDF